MTATRPGALLLSLAVLLVTLTGCSLFQSDKEREKAKRKPTPLRDFKTEVRLKSVWSYKVGKKAEDQAIRLMPAFEGSRVFVAAASGEIAALQADNGREIWKERIRSFYSKDQAKIAFSSDVDQITGGVGVGSDLVVVGTAAGELLALNQSDGTLAWRARTTSEVLAPPQIDGDLVVAQTIDGKVSGYDAFSGERRWQYSTQIPSLTLRGTSTPIITSQFVVAAFANGRIVLLDRERGIAGADERLAAATGRSDLERLIDIDGRMVLEGRLLLAAGFQGRLVALDVSALRFVWAHEVSSLVGVGTGFGNVYVVHDDSRVSALDVNSGRDVWETSDLRYRTLTAPVSVGSYIAVGDQAGYLHIIAQSDGRFVGRRKVDGDGLTSHAVADGSRLYVLGGSGRLYTFELQ